MQRSAPLLLAIAILALLAGDAFAQMGGMGGMGGGRGRNRDSGSSSPGSADCRVERPAMQPDAASYAQIDYRLNQLQGALKLSPAQAGPWQGFAVRVRALAEDVSRERGRSMVLTPGADTGPALGLGHIGQALDAARNRLTALEDVEISAKALYQTFTPEQKAEADQRLPSIIAPRAVPAAGSVAGNNVPDLGTRTAR